MILQKTVQYRSIQDDNKASNVCQVEQVAKAGLALKTLNE